MLETIPSDLNILISSDEELNTLFSKFDICILEEDNKNKPKNCVVFGLSGYEYDQY